MRARTSAVISAKLMGYVREVKVQAGDRVREGQLLVTLDTRDLDVSSRRAEAAREEVRSCACPRPTAPSRPRKPISTWHR